jgi:membrane protein
MTIGDQLLRLVTRPGEELGRLARFVQFQIRLWRFCAARLHTNNLPAMAAALSFRTIFALIPILVLAFLAAGALGVIDDSKQSLRAFLEASGFSQIGVVAEETSQPSSRAAPASAPEAINVADEILQLVERVESKLTVQRIGPIGAALLIWTALSLLSTMEQSLNRVFGAARSRSTIRRVLLYWSAMTLGPIMVALAIFVSQRAMFTAKEVPLLSLIVGPLIWLGPTLVGILVLTATYILLPNTAVNRKAALGGATVAVLFWLIARWAFAVYVDRFVLKGNLYGILGVIPLFLLWLNLSWLIFLFGAELAHTAANIRRLNLPEEDEPQIVTSDDALAVTLCVLRRYECGDGAATRDLIASNVRAGGEALHWLIERLADRGVLCRVDDKDGRHYLPARPSDKITVAEVLGAADPDGHSTAGGSKQLDGIPQMVAQVRERMQSGLRDLTLADLRAETTRK